ncbi:MAG TPA: SEL1-like repeat protein [Dissulfurispiraceae bacterium]
MRKGVAKDLRMAEKWYKKAALQGDDTSMISLAKLMTARDAKVSILSEAYGWTLLSFKRLPYKDGSAVDEIHTIQREAILKARSLGAEEKEFVSRSEAWAKKHDGNIPTDNPLFRGNGGCKYLKNRTTGK